MTRRVTLVDLAEHASVSVATVSRALSGDPQISEATQSRIRQIAADLKYVPNVAARSLVLQSTATFGLMTPDVTDPIHGQVVTGFQQQAAEHDYSVILSNGFWDADVERRALREFAAHRVAGVVVMGSVLPQTEVRRLLSPSPVLFIGSEHVPSKGGELDLPRGCLRPDDHDGHATGGRPLDRARLSRRRVRQRIVRRDARSSVATHSLPRCRPRSRRAGRASCRRRRRRRHARRRRQDPSVAARRRRLLRRQDGVAVDGRTACRRRSRAARCRHRRLRRHPVRPHLQSHGSPPSRSAPTTSAGRASGCCCPAWNAASLPATQLMPVTLVIRETTPGPTGRAPKKGNHR